MKLIKRIVIFNCIAALFLLEACASKGMDEAYSIREQYKEGSETKATEVETASIQESLPIVQEKPSFKINLNGAKVIEATDIMKYGGVSLQVLDFERGNSIYDVTKVLDEEQSNEFIQYLFNQNSRIRENGRFSGMDSADQCKLYFLKLRLTNQSNSEAVLYMKAIFYGITQDRYVGKLSNVIYDFYGEHYRKNNFADGNQYMQLMPGESKETVLLLGMYDAEYYDRYYNPDASYYTTLYLSSTTLDGYANAGGSELPVGSTLMKLMEDGKVLLHE